MIVHDFDAFRIAAAPNEANPPLVIDSDAVLGTAVCFQCFQPISRRHSQVVQRSGPVEIFELAPGNILNARWKSARTLAAKNLFGFRTCETDNHRRILPHCDNKSIPKMQHRTYNVPEDNVQETM